MSIKIIVKTTFVDVNKIYFLLQKICRRNNLTYFQTNETILLKMYRCIRNLKFEFSLFSVFGLYRTMSSM